jgi:hypothetical protein
MAPVQGLWPQTSMNDNGRPPTSGFFRWRWVASLLLIAIIIIIGSWLRQSSRRIAAPLRVSEIVHTGAPPAVKAPKPDKPPTVSAATTLDICGLGKVSLDTSDPFAIGRYFGELTNKARTRWLSALLDSDDIRARAAGLFLEGKLTGSGSVQPIEDQTRDALVQLAVGASDPAIYAMAVNACNTYSDPAPAGSCQQITLNTWARLDTDNAVPWLLVAGQAHARNDATTETAAFGQAAKAHKADAYNYSLYTFAESELPRDVTPLERWYLAIELIGIESATASLQYIYASKHCSAEAMQDRGVREQCNALAELMVGKGTTLLDLGIGTHIGARAGWSNARVARLTEELDALMQAITQTTANNNDDLWTCDGVRRGNAYMGQWVRLGEIGAARDSLDRSGETVAELAQKRRDFIDKIRRDAQRREEAAPSEPPP